MGPEKLISKEMRSNKCLARNILAATKIFVTKIFLPENIKGS